MTPEQLQTLATEIALPAYAGLSYAAIAAALNARSFEAQANPEPQGDVPNLPTLEEIMDTVAAVDLAGLKSFLESVPSASLRLPDDVDRALAGNMTGVIVQRQVAALYLSVEALAALDALLARTQPDPAWQATISVAQPSRAEALGLPRVTAEAVQAADHLEAN